MREDHFRLNVYGAVVPARLILAGVVLLAGVARQALRAQDITEIDLFKRSWYTQTGDADPVPVSAAAGPFDISAEAYLDSNVDPDFIGGMTIKTPSGLTLGMNGPDASFGFGFYDDRVLASQLNARYGAGTYRFTYSSPITGTSSWNVPLAADDYPPSPKILNSQAGQSIDPTKEFTVQWTGFSGDGQSSAELYVLDVENSSTVFDSGLLPATQTTSTIPPATLEAGKTYQAELQFTRLTYMSPSSSPGLVSGFEATTSTSLKTAGGNPPPAPVINSITLQPDGSVQLSITCTTGRDLVIQGISEVGGTWSNLQTVTPQSSPATVTLTAADLGTRQIIRAYQ